MRSNNRQSFYDFTPLAQAWVKPTLTRIDLTEDEVTGITTALDPKQALREAYLAHKSKTSV